MMRRLLLWIAARLPVREITHQGAPYLERYYVATLLGWRVYLHRFVGNDPDGLHDHPFNYSFSLILAGWYYEERRDGLRRRRWVNWVGADTFHRVILPADLGGRAATRDVWTLFFHSRRVKEWGFLRRAREAARTAKRTVYFYVPVAGGDRGHATWHLAAPKGRELWARQSHDRAAATQPNPAMLRGNRGAT